MCEFDNLKIALTPEEIDILGGKQGPTLRKIMKTLVLYGEALGAERLADIEGDGHFVIPWVTPGIAPPSVMLDELVEAGLKTKFPFTLDPRPPLDFENLSLDPDQEKALREAFIDQTRYDERMLQLGLRSPDDYTCNPYQPEVNNIPERHSILAWSESACAAFANSVIGARTNRTGAIMDLLSNIAGKTPLAGLLTEEGRKANWRVEVRTEKRPHPGLLGAVIGRKVLADVPFIVGLDRFLRNLVDEEVLDYLQELGAACATYGAVGLFHVENITPEAVDHGESLLLPDYSTYIIYDRELQDIRASFPIQWSEAEAKPTRCYIGCPHLSLKQLNWWADSIQRALEEHGQHELVVKTVLCAAPQVLRAFMADARTYASLKRAGLEFSPTCVETLYEHGIGTGDPTLTNSIKLRAYSTARFVPDEELVDILVRGEISEGA